MNLVVNARDAMPGGRAGDDRDRQSSSSSAADGARGNGVRPGAYVTLAVSDTGVGMDVPTQARIFEPFFTTKDAGQGHRARARDGLRHRRAERRAHRRRERAGPGHHVHDLPAPTRGRAPAPPVAGQPDRRSLPSGTETLLLVEDEAAVRASARRLLERHGYTVLEARHGADALRIVESGDRPIDLVLTDLVMPEMGGRELVERLRARHPALKVLFMSGYSERAVTVGRRHAARHRLRGEAVHHRAAHPADAGDPGRLAAG